MMKRHTLRKNKKEIINMKVVKDSDKVVQGESLRQHALDKHNRDNPKFPYLGWVFSFGTLQHFTFFSKWKATFVKQYEKWLSRV